MIFDEKFKTKLNYTELLNESKSVQIFLMLNAYFFLIFHLFYKYKFQSFLESIISSVFLTYIWCAHTHIYEKNDIYISIHDFQFLLKNVLKYI